MDISFEEIYGFQENKDCPRFDIPDKVYQEINRLFKGYIFYEKSKENKGNRSCHCTVCNSSFEVGYQSRTMEDREAEIYYGPHNYRVICPKCGTGVTLKNIGISRAGKNLFEHIRITVVLPQNHREVIVATFEVSKDYSIPLPSIYFARDKVYCITPKRSDCWKWDYYRKSLCESSKIYKPFDGGNHSEVNVNTGSLSKTFLKYCGWEFYKGTKDLAVFLAKAPSHPPYEMMLKMGFKDFVDESIDGKENVRLINWQGKKPTEVFKKMDKQQINELRKIHKIHHVNPVWFTKDWVELNRYGKFTLTETYKIKDTCYDWKNILKKASSLGISANELLNYGLKQDKKRSDQTHRQNALSLWRDYIRDAEFLKYDLKNPVVSMPKDLVAAHQTSIDLRRAVEEEERRKAEAKRQKQQEKQHIKWMEAEKKLVKKRKKQYEYRSDGFLVRVPEDIREIIAEGQALRHCVGGYAERHATGKTTILFMRSEADPDTPLYTIEMHDTKLRQIHGMGNCALQTESEKQFFQNWTSWVESGSKSQKRSVDKETKINIKLERVTA